MQSLDWCRAVSDVGIALQRAGREKDPSSPQILRHWKMTSCAPATFQNSPRPRFTQKHSFCRHDSHEESIERESRIASSEPPGVASTSAPAKMERTLNPCASEGSQITSSLWAAAVLPSSILDQHLPEMLAAHSRHNQLASDQGYLRSFPSEAPVHVPQSHGQTTLRIERINVSSSSALPAKFICNLTVELQGIPIPAMPPELDHARACVVCVSWSPEPDGTIGTPCWQ